MGTFDGSIDPCDHLESFKALMMLQETFDTLMYKTFLITFRDVARAWYTRLPLDSINSFEEFG